MAMAKVADNFIFLNINYDILVNILNVVPLPSKSPIIGGSQTGEGDF